MKVYKKKGLYECIFKRFFDVVLSSLAIIVLSPVLGISALLVKAKLGSPVIFKQPRPGMNEKIFSLYKFRSMTNETDADGKLLPDSKRLTKFGKFLRKSSIDELPELFNILKGDMSIVGPRPLSIYYLPHYEKDAKARHNVRPGLTGWAQINGRNNLPWDDRFRLDLEYVKNISLIGDIKIILGTVFKVLRAADISVRGTTKVYDFGTYHILKEEGNIPVTEHAMTYSEIGSYFWINPEDMGKEIKEIDFLPRVNDSSFTFSGRTAIDIALRNIQLTKDVKTVYVPSYCCVSMLQAFVDGGIKVSFYDVDMLDTKMSYRIDTGKKCDVLLIMSYFGFGIDEKTVALVSKLKKQGTAVIEDITHSLFDNKPYYTDADYLVVSLRKWFETPAGGWIGKRNGALGVKPDLESEHTVTAKIKGMVDKRAYILLNSADPEKKAEYLEENSKFDNDLIHVDRMLKMDQITEGIISNTDISAMKNIRRDNALYLSNSLKDLSDVILLPEIDLNQTTPLFYPIFMKEEERDSLRKYLTSCGIYCPVHWPEVMGAKIGVRANELSLICDQRYGINDMKAISDLIHKWYTKEKA